MQKEKAINAENMIEKMLQFVVSKNLVRNGPTLNEQSARVLSRFKDKVALSQDPIDDLKAKIEARKA